jgi:hypothetical protein
MDTTQSTQLDLRGDNDNGESTIQQEHMSTRLSDEVITPEEEFEPDEHAQQAIDVDLSIRQDDDIQDETHSYGLRKHRNHSNWKTCQFENHVSAIILLGLSMKKAVKLYGVEAVVSVMKEMNQLYYKSVFHPVHYKDINDHSKVIRSLLFLKRKRDDTKGEIRS